MRIAYIGLKGLPATYSGIETHVHELGNRLVQRGHDVTAYVRPQYAPRHIKSDGGIQLVHLPTIPTKHLDATVHSFLTALHTIGNDFDIVHFHTIGPGCFSVFSRLSGARVVVTIHRFDYFSGKWGWFARNCLRLAEQVSLRVPHGVIAVAPFLQAHYQSRGYRVEYIPNGVALPSPGIGASRIAKWGLVANQYVLFLGRLVPEKRPDWAIRAFLEIESSTMKLVIAGGSSQTDQYVEHLKRLAGNAADRIIFTGSVYDSIKDELLANARLFVLPSALEGLPITLLEAMSHSRPCLVSDIPPHRDVIQDRQNGLLHRMDDFDHLRRRLSEVLTAPPPRLADLGGSARETVAKEYNWERITHQTESFYGSLLSSPQLVNAPAARPERVAEAANLNRQDT